MGTPSMLGDSPCRPRVGFLRAVLYSDKLITTRCVRWPRLSCELLLEHTVFPIACDEHQVLDRGDIEV
jgi:hypothetical protein